MTVMVELYDETGNVLLERREYPADRSEAAEVSFFKARVVGRLAVTIEPELSIGGQAHCDACDAIREFVRDGLCLDCRVFAGVATPLDKVADRVYQYAYGRGQRASK